MKRFLRCLLVLGAAVLPAQFAMAQSLSGNPLSGLERLKTFETMRASSSDQNWRNGNDDARPIEPGKTLTLAEMDGPGIITHIWCTIGDPDCHAGPVQSNNHTCNASLGSACVGQGPAHDSF